MLWSVRSSLRGLFLAAAFASAASAEVVNESIAPKLTELARICESARLTDIERRECRAAFKAADDADERQDAYDVFHERINGPTVRR